MIKVIFDGKSIRSLRGGVDGFYTAPSFYDKNRVKIGSISGLKIFDRLHRKVAECDRECLRDSSKKKLIDRRELQKTIKVHSGVDVLVGLLEAIWFFYVKDDEA